MYVFYTIDIIFFLFFFLNYIVFIYFLFIIFGLFTQKFINSSISSLFIISSFLFFIGLPPLGLFLFKFYTFLTIINNLSLNLTITFWLFSFIATIGYFKSFYKIFINSSYLFFFSPTDYNNKLGINFLIFFASCAYLFY